MKNIVLSIIMVLFSFIKLSAQKNIVNSGIILYEEKVNFHKQMQRFGGEWYEQMKDKLPKYNSVYYETIFNDSSSLYRKAKEQPPKDGNIPQWMDNAQKEPTIIYKNHNTNRVLGEKLLLNEKFILDDTLLNLKWKMVDEFRIIAGYNCRRATTILNDSLYIIAYYTDAISCSTGPLSLSGLPGAMLGVVIPKLNVTYFAREVKTTLPETEKIVAPTKGTKTTYEKAVKLINDKASDGWMKQFKNEFIWQFIL